jgi:hypothetical protein
LFGHGDLQGVVMAVLVVAEVGDIAAGITAAAIACWQAGRTPP